MVNYDNLAPDYPLLFRNGRPSCGISVCKGWENLIRETLTKIEQLLPIPHDFKVTQVKEKFGGLRFYYAAPLLSQDIKEKIQAIVTLAESRSFGACKVCGGPATQEPLVGKLGWVRTLCSLHREDISALNPTRQIPVENIELK